MNIKKFLLIKACSRLPTELIENIWTLVKTDAKQTIQEKIQDMYYRKIELVRCMYLKLDNFSNSNTAEKQSIPARSKGRQQSKLTKYNIINNIITHQT
jgi:hypothetical protein